ncbi:MAG TPA: alpha/beta fold hydrolase [Caulobacteraceae bacterium]|jgi:pimeloyl-ACP methyl ester carboxylesterase
MQVLTGLLAAAALAGAPTAGDSAASQPRLRLAPCSIAGVEGPLECGTLTVAENRATGRGRMLPLKVVVARAKSPQPREPIFILSGGPGQAATDAVGGFTGGPQQQEHDIVFMDLRGTGEGHRLACRTATDENLQGYLEPLFNERELIRACRAELEKSADLTQYTTPISMQDLDDLRRALGYGKINLLGGSYGSRTGIVYMRMYPQHVHAAVLMSLAPLSSRAPLHFAKAAQGAFEALVEDCRAEPACKAAYPDPHGDIAAILAALKREPARVQVRHPATGAPAEVTLTPSAFGDGLRVMLYSSETGRQVPLLLQRARAGDYRPFAEAALAANRGARNSLALGLTLSSSCPEDTARIRPEEVETATAGSFIGDYRVRAQMAACELWPKGKMPADYFREFPTTVPTLLVSGRLDPVTPPERGEDARRLLPNSLHIVTPGSHSEAGDCVGAIGLELFRTGSVKGLDTSCVGKLKMPPFVLPGQAPPPA